VREPAASADARLASEGALRERAAQVGVEQMRRGSRHRGGTAREWQAPSERARRSAGRSALAQAAGERGSRTGTG
jgi:hypothetical protein